MKSVSENLFIDGWALSRTIVDEQEMLAFGHSVARVLVPRLVITLSGDLGVGKTTLARGVIQGLGFSGIVKSPTYAMLEPYHLDSGAVYHFDLYRMSDPEELEFLGYRDCLRDAYLCLVEWPERSAGYLRNIDLELLIKSNGVARIVTGRAHTLAGKITNEHLQHI